jgi:predicted phosphoribosyltransferase
MLVDDGAATGATMRAAVRALKIKTPLLPSPPDTIVGLPVTSSEAAEQLRNEAGDVVALIETNDFHSVGQWYQVFDQTSDTEVLSCLRKASERFAHGRSR